jgi:hypothetical protein
MSESTLLSRLRQGVLALAFLATLMVPLELLLIEHYEEPFMLIPFVLSGLALLAMSMVLIWPNKNVLRFFQVVMVLLIIGSLLGVFFHLSGNLEVVEEVHSDLRGLPMIWEVLSSAAPALAPGLLAQVGLMGLLYSYKHPVFKL